MTQGNTGVVATPSEEQTNNILRLANELIPVLKCIGPCRVNSWLRTEEHNAAVHGALHSSHLLGAAVDLHPIDNTVEDCKALLRTQAERVLFFEINTTNWLHLSWIPGHDFIA